MAAEARAESPAPALAPPSPVPEKRAAAEDDEQPGPKRRRAFVATLDGVVCVAAAHGKTEEDGHCDGSSFSFQHARGGFVALETTPKFGSFNPPTAAAEQQEALDQKPAPPAALDSPVAEEEEDAASPRGFGDPKDENSQLVVAAEVDQGETERPNESE